MRSCVSFIFDNWKIATSPCAARWPRKRLATITDLHKAIYRKFEQAGIVIAFPQRDLHLDTRERLRISIEETSRVEDEVDDSGAVGRRDSRGSGTAS